LSVRTQYLKDEEGHHLEAFYALRPVRAPIYQNYDKIPMDFLTSFQGMAQQELQAVYDGQKPLGEALDSLQAKAQEALILANQKKESPGTGSTNTGGP
jgi:multiple sugar transport system substrate-binding protein